MRVMRALLSLYRWPVVNLVVRQLVFILGADIPTQVRIGARICLQHRGLGTVMQPDTVIGDDCSIYHGVTLGRKDPASTAPAPIRIGNRVDIRTGAIIAAPDGGLTIGDDSIVGPGTILTHSIGAREFWMGSPARLIRTR